MFVHPRSVSRLAKKAHRRIATPTLKQRRAPSMEVVLTYLPTPHCICCRQKARAAANVSFPKAATSLWAKPSLTACLFAAW